MDILHQCKASNTTGTPGDASIFQWANGELDLLDMFRLNSGMLDMHPREQQSRYI